MKSNLGQAAWNSEGRRKRTLFVSSLTSKDRHTPMNLALRTLARRLGAALSFVAVVAAGAGPAPAQSVPLISNGIPIAVEFGKQQGDLSPSEVQFIAHNVTIAALEHFGGPGAPYAYQEDGVAANAARLKAANPAIKVLEYWGFAGTGHMNYRAYTDPTFQANKDSWYVLRPGQKKARLDITNPAVRNWWAAAATRMVSQGHLDGIWLDGAMNTKRDPWRDAKIELFRTLREDLDALHQGHKFIVINGNAENYFASGLAQYTDGIMIEWYDLVVKGVPRTPEQNLAYLQAAYDIGRSGKEVWLKGWPYPHDFIDSDWNKNASYQQKVSDSHAALGFALASHLVSNTPGYSFLSYSWGYAVDSFEIVTNHDADPKTWVVDQNWYPEFKRDYGAPLGPMQVNGFVLTRQYPGGTARVDLSSHTFTLPQPVR